MLAAGVESNNKLELDALHDFGITDAVIDKYQLGLEDLRIIIPVYSKTGQVH